LLWSSCAKRFQSSSAGASACVATMMALQAEHLQQQPPPNPHPPSWTRSMRLTRRCVNPAMAVGESRAKTWIRACRERRKGIHERMRGHQATTRCEGHPRCASIRGVCCDFAVTHVAYKNRPHHSNSFISCVERTFAIVTSPYLSPDTCHRSTFTATSRQFIMKVCGVHLGCILLVRLRCSSQNIRKSKTKKKRID
jgi:hypothetical protein